MLTVHASRQVLARYDISRHQPLLDTLAISTEGLTAEAALPRIARETCRYMTELGLKPATSGQFHHIDNVSCVQGLGSGFMIY
jgi:hypothetical protein